MIDADVLRRLAGVETSVPFQVDGIGLVADTATGSILTFLDDERFLPGVLANPTVTVVLATEALESSLVDGGKTVVVVDDPRGAYYRLHNAIARESVQHEVSSIDATAVIHPAAVVAERGVSIGPGTRVDAGSVIESGVRIGRDCVIQANVVIGSSGFEHKRTLDGVVAVFHDGTLVIDDEVEIGANTVVAQGFVRRPTRIGRRSRVDSQVQIAHGVQLGEAVFVAAGVSLAGSVTVGDGTWIGVGATIIDRITIGRGANVGAGAVVFRDVDSGVRVLGNPARPIATG